MNNKPTIVEAYTNRIISASPTLYARDGIAGIIYAHPTCEFLVLLKKASMMSVLVRMDGDEAAIIELIFSLD